MMVWPPPKVPVDAEGELTIERPRGPAPEMSSVVQGPSARIPAPSLPGATVSVMAATSTPQDWLQHPEGLIGCVLGSRYRITSIIGRGPMGIACEGESSRGRQVTLKLLPRAPELPAEHFAWQVRQALALAYFDHPNVSPFSDFGALEDGGAFVSRARTPGVSLRTILRQGSLPVPRALALARQLASALASAHAQDIAHGRLKPENIIVHGDARPGDVIKVVDFGMAGLSVDQRAVAADEAEAARLALRTRTYLPAEVTGASPALDVYSLGVLLFEMLAGLPPYPPEALGPSGPLAPPLELARVNPGASVPPAVRELVSLLLAPRAAEQGLGAARVAEMIEALLGRPSAGAPDPVTTQLGSAQPPPVQPIEAPTARIQAPDIQAFAVPSAELSWPPSSSAPAAVGSSFPPLPGGISTSTFPPPVTEARASGGARSDESLSNLEISDRFRRLQAGVDEPSSAPEADDLEPEFRPSLIGRLKRLFAKKRPEEL